MSIMVKVKGGCGKLVEKGNGVAQRDNNVPKRTDCFMLEQTMPFLWNSSFDSNGIFG